MTVYTWGCVRTKDSLAFGLNEITEMVAEETVVDLNIASRLLLPTVSRISLGSHVAICF